MRHVIVWLSVVAAGSAFVAGRLSAPEVPKMPAPGHIWIGFEPKARSAYYVNNGNQMQIHGLAYTCRPGTNGVRTWNVRFEEETR